MFVTPGRGTWRLALCATAALVVASPFAAAAQSESGAELYRKGRSVFRDKGCIQCHSVFGRDGKGGPDLGRRKAYGTHLHLAARMWNHFPRMHERMQKENVEFKRITATEMGHLIAYLSFIRYRGEPGNEYKGQQLLRKRCSKCHKFRGKGGDIGPEFDETSGYMSSIRLVESMWNHGPDMLETFREHGIKRPVFKGHDIEHMLAAMRAYTSTTRVPEETFMGDPVRGKVCFSEKGCVRCHSIRGRGGAGGPDFADVEFDYSAVQIAGRMWNHGPKMWEAMQRKNIVVPEFEKGEMADLIAYLYSLKLQDEPGNADRGYRLVLEKGCLRCHSLQGQGGDVAADLSSLDGMDSPLAMIAAMWNHAPGMRDEHVEKHRKWPKLNARDMADLYAYLHKTTTTPDGDE
ncbi:MAG: c-type cytochrome [Candidatus Krumholzibacteriia bacterium]